MKNSNDHHQDNQSECSEPVSTRQARTYLMEDGRIGHWTCKHCHLEVTGDKGKSIAIRTPAGIHFLHVE